MIWSTVIVGSMVTIVLTLLLIYGVRSNKSAYFLPWLAESVVGIVVTFGVGLVKILSGTAPNVPQYIVMMIVILPCYGFWVYGVASLYVLIRRMKQHTTEIINSVMQGKYYTT